MWVFRPHAISSAFMHAFKHGMIIHRATLLSTKSPEEDRSPLKILRGGPVAPLTNQLLTFCDYPGEVDATNNGSERKLRPCVIQRKVTNGFRAMWAAKAEADVRTTVFLRRGPPGIDLDFCIAV